MTVGVKGSERPGRLLEVITETPLADGEMEVALAERVGLIHPDLRTGANLSRALSLRANEGLCSRGVQLMGAGFIVTAEQAKALGFGLRAGIEQHIRPYLNGRDLTGHSRRAMVIDLFGLKEAEVRQRFPEVYQWVLERVMPDREQNNRPSYRKSWWIFGEPRGDLRPALVGLHRYIVTVETAKHRVFFFQQAEVVPDNKLIVFGVSDPFVLGVLSSALHTRWAWCRRGLLEDRPVYVKSLAFDPSHFLTAAKNSAPISAP